MAEIQLNIASNVLKPAKPVVSPKKETSSVSKVATEETLEVQQTKQERLAEDQIERDIVAVSKDGDTVAVSKERNADATESNTETPGRMEEEREYLEEEQQKPPVELETIEAPELKPMEAPKIEVEMTTYSGVSDERMEQMLVEGKISQHEYDAEMKAREAKRDAEIQELAQEQRQAAAYRSARERVEQEDIMLENAFGDEGNDRISPEIRSDAVTKLQERTNENARRSEEEGRLWDYQFLA